MNKSRLECFGEVWVVDHGIPVPPTMVDRPKKQTVLSVMNKGDSVKVTYSQANLMARRAKEQNIKITRRVLDSEEKDDNGRYFERVWRLS